MKYRAEIDGLRTVAVMPVVLFHAGIGICSGGFVGVDVFFVISGYLITTILLSEMERGSFTLAGFYERRARRILPALFLILFFSWILAFLWFFPPDMKNFSESLGAVSIFSSNILFWLQAGYWDTASELKPLLHTWSLAVEEQYYLLFPLFLMAMWRFRRRWIFASFIFITLCSLVLAQWGVIAFPEAAFYLLPTRGWELAIGAGISFYCMYRHAPFLATGARTGLPQQLLPLLGLVMIFYAVVFFDRQTPFPGLHALFPTIGAGLIILFCTPQSLVGKLLASRPFVAIGLISYSVYLWHYMLLAFARYRLLGTTYDQRILLPIALASLPLAFLSWRFVERPFRLRDGLQRKTIFIFAACGTLLFAMLGLAGHIYDGWSERVDSRILVTKSQHVCEAHAFDPDKICQLAAGNKKDAILIGDSHSEALADEMQQVFTGLDIGLSHIFRSGCPPIENVYRADRGLQETFTDDSCYAYNKALYGYLQDHQEITTVIMAARWPLTMEGSPFDNGEGGVESSSHPPHLDLVVDGKAQYHPNYSHRPQLAAAYKASISKLLSLGKNVILIYPVPEVGWSVPHYLSDYLNHHRNISSATDIPPLTGSTSYQRFLERTARTYQALNDIGLHARLFRVYPEAFFCSEESGRCVVQQKGVPFYKDDNHLSNRGARPIAEAVGKIVGGLAP